MQQILLVQNSLCLNTSSIEFAAHIAGITKSRVYGLLVEQPEKEYAVYAGSDEEENSAFNNSVINKGLIADNMQLFENVEM